MTKKFFFGCPTCKSHYLELFARGTYRKNTVEGFKSVRYHKFMCTKCWEVFIRITDGGKVIETKIDDHGKYTVVQ